MHRRAADELGARITEPVALLPDFRYRAVMDDGTVENEICPVYVARLLSTPHPNPDEVAEVRWLPYADLVAAVAAEPLVYSPWLREQLRELAGLAWQP